MTEYQQMLEEDKKWYKDFQSMKVPDRPCDVCRTNTATRWFGNTSAMLCASEKCLQEQQRKYDDYRSESECWGRIIGYETNKN